MKPLPKSLQPPEVVGTSSGVQGFDDFEQWASRNVPIWNRCRHYGAGCFDDSREYLKLVAYFLVLENLEMRELLIKHAEETATHTFPPR